MTHIYHYSIIQSSFTALNILCILPMDPSLPPLPLTPSCQFFTCAWLNHIYLSISCGWTLNLFSSIQCSKQCCKEHSCTHNLDTFSSHESLLQIVTSVLLITRPLSPSPSMPHVPWCLSSPSIFPTVHFPFPSKSQWTLAKTTLQPTPLVEFVRWAGMQCHRRYSAALT